MIGLKYTTKKKAFRPPACPSCGRRFEAGLTWPGANFCRGFTLLPFIEENPGLSGWELSQLAGMDYSDASRGLARLREYSAVATEAEEREAGGIRYRYSSAENPLAIERFLAVLRRAEGLS
jgi:hypothetical protein